MNIFLKFLILILVSTFFNNQLSAQVEVRANIGYARSLYNIEEYNESQTGFLPAWVLVSGWAKEETLMIGAEYRVNIYCPSFALRHPTTYEKAFTRKYKGQYLGIFGRYYFLDLPAFAQAGMGLCMNNNVTTKYEQSYLESEPWLKEHLTGSEEKDSYKMAFGFNIGVGISFGPERRFDFLMRYSMHKNTLAGSEYDMGYAAGDFTFGLGVKL